MSDTQLLRHYPYIGIGILLLSLVPMGCGNSQESGTQVQYSEKEKAQINARRDAYKNRSAKKAQAATPGKS